MLEQLIHRLFAALLTLFAVISLTFFLLRALPGGPFDTDRRLPPEVQQNLEAKYHLDKPLAEQYFIYIQETLQGDLGPSYTYRTRTVTDIIDQAAPVSAWLGLLALVIGTFLGALLGTLAGMTRSVFWDNLLSVLGITSISVPSFIFAGFLVMVFALQLGWLPAATLSGPQHYVLPVIALSLLPFSYAFLLIRTSVKEVKAQLYVRTKHSFGLSDRLITSKHILRNSLIPLVSILGPIAAAIMTGSFAVEYIFAIPGLGKHFVNAVSNRDYTLVTGITIVYSLALITFNMLTDLLNVYLDPRLKNQPEA